MIHQFSLSQVAKWTERDFTVNVQSTRMVSTKHHSNAKQTPMSWFSHHTTWFITLYAWGLEKKSNWTSWDGIIPDKRQSYTGVFWNLVSLSYLTVWTRMYLCVRVCVCVRMSTNPHMSLFRLCLSALLCKGYGLQFWEIALKRIHDYYQWGNFW